jgi:hypothetical protein
MHLRYKLRNGRKMGGIGGTRVPATATFWGPEGRDGTGREGEREGAAHSHTTVKKMMKTALIMATSFAPTSKKTLGSARSGAGSLFFDS